jgi:hypothetical protein
VLAALALALFAATPEGLPEPARARYLDAIEKLNARQYGRANDLLNSLAVEHPQIAEVFASRCSAQLGLQHWAAAEADCEYTLKLKQLPTAVYGLAVAEDGQGKYGEAVMHYRQYAGLAEATAALKQQAMTRADLLASRSVAPPPPGPPEKSTQPIQAPPPPGGGKGQFVPGIPDPGEGLLYVYRNLLPGVGTMTTLFVDNKRVGDLWNDHYFEVRLKAGNHDVTLKTAASDPKQRQGEHAMQVEIIEGELSYVKLEYAAQNDPPGFKLLRVGKEGRKEIREACELVYSKKL